MVMATATCAGVRASAVVVMPATAYPGVSASARPVIVVETSGVAESICWVSAAASSVC
jgi:hypothetical protein